MATPIAGAVRDELLLCHELCLPRPAARLLESRKTVIIDHLDLTPGSLLLQGRLRAQCLYRVAETPHCGPVWSTTADIAFQRLLALPGAHPGMKCHVTEAHVIADTSILLGPERIRGSSLIAITVTITGAGPRAGVVAARPGQVIGRRP